jgi:mRNA interferase MazF
MAACPDRGDLITCYFGDTSGHEQSGYRRALVLSPKVINLPTNLAIVCPITTHKRGYPFEVDIPDGLCVTGVILANQIRTIDWRSRNIEIIDQLAAIDLSKVQLLIAKLIL